MLVIGVLIGMVVGLAFALVVTQFSPKGLVHEAQANIVEGKTWFSTSSPDGTVVYLWNYDYEGTGEDLRAKVRYYGQIRAGGDFEKYR